MNFRRRRVLLLRAFEHDRHFLLFRRFLRLERGFALNLEALHLRARGPAALHRLEFRRRGVLLLGAVEGGIRGFLREKLRLHRRALRCGLVVLRLELRPRGAAALHRLKLDRRGSSRLFFGDLGGLFVRGVRVGRARLRGRRVRVDRRVRGRVRLRGDLLRGVSIFRRRLRRRVRRARFRGELLRSELRDFRARGAAALDALQLDRRRVLVVRRDAAELDLLRFFFLLRGRRGVGFRDAHARAERGGVELRGRGFLAHQIHGRPRRAPARDGLDLRRGRVLLVRAFERRRLWGVGAEVGVGKVVGIASSGWGALGDGRDRRGGRFLIESRRVKNCVRWLERERAIARTSSSPMVSDPRTRATMSPPRGSRRSLAPARQAAALVCVLPRAPRALFRDFPRSSGWTLSRVSKFVVATTERDQCWGRRDAARSGGRSSCRSSPWPGS